MLFTIYSKYALKNSKIGIYIVNTHTIIVKLRFI